MPRIFRGKNAICEGKFTTLKCNYVLSRGTTMRGFCNELKTVVSHCKTMAEYRNSGRITESASGATTTVLGLSAPKRGTVVRLRGADCRLF